MPISVAHKQKRLADYLHQLAARRAASKLARALRQAQAQMLPPVPRPKPMPKRSQRIVPKTPLSASVYLRPAGSLALELMGRDMERRS